MEFQKKKLWRSQLDLKCDNPFLSVPGAQNKQPWYKAWRPTWKSINQRMSELKQTRVIRLNNHSEQYTMKKSITQTLQNIWIV